MRFPRLLAGALACAMTQLPARGARAEPIRVSVEDCTFDRDDFVRLVRLELETVLVLQAAHHGVVVSCHDGQVKLRIHDSVTGKTLERTVIAPPETSVEPERLLALSVAQLYRAAWLELLANDPAPLPSAEPAPKPGEVAAARRAAERTLPQRPPPPPARPDDARPRSVDARLGVGARSLAASPLVMPRVEIGAAISPLDRLWLSVEVRGERGVAERPTGEVRVVGLGASVGALYEPFRTQRVAVLTGLDLGPSHVQMDGQAPAAGFGAGSAEGIGLDADLVAGGGLRFGIARIELLSRIGWRFGPPTGRVAGSEPVSVEGVWVAQLIGLRLSM